MRKFTLKTHLILKEKIKFKIEKKFNNRTKPAGNTVFLQVGKKFSIEDFSG